MNYKNSFKNLNVDIVDGDRGKNYPHNDELSTCEEVLFLSNKNIINNKLNLENALYISQIKHKQMGKGSLSISDIVLTTRGTLGNILFIDNKFKLPARINSGMVIIRPVDKYIPKFLYYYLISNKFKNNIEQTKSGAAQPQLPIKDLENIKLPECNLPTQRHIVDSIGSVDDAIEKNEEIIEKIYSFLTNKFNELVYGKNTISFGDLKYLNIVKSGIDKFEGNKIYIDTSSVSNKSIIDTSYNITYDDRPSRANMQPRPNTVWFAKLKDSPKFIIVKNLSKRILNNYVFSTGFMGLETNDYIINYLYLLILSSSFNNQKDVSSTGATMMGINNDILYSIKVPNITKGEACSFGKEIDNFIETIVRLQEKNYILKLIKKNLLSKYFD